MNDKERTDHETEVQEFRQARWQRLLAPDGWLALVDKVVLSEGDTEIDIGTITLRSGSVRFRARPGLIVTCEGAPVLERALRDDEPGPPDVLVWGTRRYEVVRRGDWRAVRVRDPESPTRRAFQGLAFYPVNPAWRIEARFVPYDPPRSLVRRFEVGEGTPEVCPGAAELVLEGRTFRLEPTWTGEPGGRLFILFGDETNRDETYRAGRFLYATAPREGRLVLDFNKAFNPPCAFTPFASCPLVPPEARLPIRIETGEKRPVSAP